MEKINCLRCNFRHTDNGNCTAVGGFCTAVPAAHCPLLRDFLDTGLTPDEIRNMSGEWCAAMSVLNGMGSYDRLRELVEADKDGRVIVLPAKKGDTLYVVTRFGVEKRVVKEIAAPFFYNTYESSDRAALSTAIRNFGKTVSLTREEAERAMQEMGGKKDG